MRIVMLDSAVSGTSRGWQHVIIALTNGTHWKGALTAPITRQSLYVNNITRRDFISCAITLAGGVAMFSLPGQALAAEGLVAGISAPSKTAFEDSLGRSLSIAKPASSVVPLGIYAQTLIETLYPGALASFAKEVSGDAADFVEAGLADIVILDDTSFPSLFFSCEEEVCDLWKGVRAVGEGRFAVAPALMHSVLGSVIFAQSIGMFWMGFALF